MAKANAVWGLDIGQCALKALKLRRAGADLQVEAFDIIEHAQILSQPDADRPALIRSSLEQFLARNPLAGAALAVSMPGLASFPCYVKLPPVEPRRIPDIIRFEAQQQIPLPIDEVVWQWQTFRDEDSPDIEVGIFAVRRSDLSEMLSHFAAIAMEVDLVQMAPLALHNFMMYDGQTAPDGATLLVDVGADKTDLVVADKARMWTRTIRIGGNNFTEALVRAFKLSFSKAEKLKRTAATSKYARQIFQAMRPVFADLVQEIQRSLGHYTSLHRESRFKRLLALGNGFRLPGLQKYLEQNLNVPVHRLDGYNRLKATGPADTPVFTENVMSFAVCYGLAVQELAAAAIDTNLLPTEVARRRLWSAKRPWFAAAAALLLAALAGPVWRGYSDRAALGDSPAISESSRIEQNLSQLDTQISRYRNEGEQEAKQVQTLHNLYGYRDLQPGILNMVSQSIGAVATNQPRLDDAEADRAKALAELRKIPRAQRRVIFQESLLMRFLPEAAYERLQQPLDSGEKVGVTPQGPGWRITLTGRTPLPLSETNTGLLRPLLLRSAEIAAQNLGDLPSPIRVLDKNVTDMKTYKTLTGVSSGSPSAGRSPAVDLSSLGGGPAAEAAPAGPAMPDPLFPDEDMSNDTWFRIEWIVLIQNDGLRPLAPVRPSADGGAAGPQR